MKISSRRSYVIILILSTLLSGIAIIIGLVSSEMGSVRSEYFNFLWIVNLLVSIVALLLSFPILYLFYVVIKQGLRVLSVSTNSKLLAIIITFIIFSQTLVQLTYNLASPYLSYVEQVLNYNGVERIGVGNETTYEQGYDDGYEDGYEYGKQEQLKNATDGSRDNVRVVLKSELEKDTYGLVVDRLRSAVGIPLRLFGNVLNTQFAIKLAFAVIFFCVMSLLSEMYLFTSGITTMKEFLDANRFNIFYIVVFAFGSFLSVSSIIALPELRKSNDRNGLLIEDFEAQINKYPVDESTVESFEYDWDLSNFQKAKKAQEDFISDVVEETPDVQIKKSVIESISQNERQFRSEIKSFKNVISDFPNQLEKFKKQLIADYDSKTKNYIATGGEVGDYFYDMLDYYNSYQQSYLRHLTNAKSELDYKFEYNSNVLQLILDSEEGSLESNRQNFYTQNVRSSQFNFLSSSPPTLDGYFNEENSFRKLAKWLIVTKSEEMMLIAGMLGFGFLGAGISSVIRDRKEKVMRGQVQSRISSVLVGGVSASLVIFLAAKGGFAIFSEGKVDLNPYTLLFLCFIGSVYSEAVWRRAQSYIDPKPEGNSQDAST